MFESLELVSQSLELMFESLEHRMNKGSRTFFPYRKYHLIQYTIK